MTKKVLLLTNSDPEEKTGSSMRDDIFLSFYKQNEEFDTDICVIQNTPEELEIRLNEKSEIQDYSRPEKFFNRFLNLFEGIHNESVKRYFPHDIVEEMEYDIVQVENENLFQIGRKISEKDGAKLFYDYHNVEYELALEHRSDLIGKWRSHRIKKREKEAAETSDLSFCCSERDRKLLWGKPEIIPNAINLENYDFDSEEPEEYQGMQKIAVFVGDMEYKPNIEAAENIQKIAEEAENWNFFLVGRNPTEKVREIGEKENIYVIGSVEEVEPYIQHSDVCLAPLDSGSGTRLKILEYLAYEKPVISTSKGAEGLEIDDIIIEDNIENYSKKLQQAEKMNPELPETYTYTGVHEKLLQLIGEKIGLEN
jgi:glycosyltransferase involved in cell wall biosynthesis